MSVWTPVVGQLLQVQPEAEIMLVPSYATAVILNDAVVGHLPRELFRLIHHSSWLYLDYNELKASCVAYLLWYTLSIRAN